MKKLFILFMSVLLGILSSCPNVWAQDTQSAVCTHTEVINSDLAKKLPLFKKYKNCLQVVLYENKNNAEKELEVLYQPENAILKDRIKVSSEQLRFLCDEIAQLQSPNPLNGLDQRGRGGLVASSMLLSLGYYGWAAPIALNKKDDEKAYVASYMLVGSASFFVPFLITRNKTITTGMAQAYGTGGVLGIGHGWLTTILIQGQNVETKTGLGLSVATSLGESMLGLALAKQYNLNPQNIGWAASGSVWGAAAGAGITYLADSENYRMYALSALLGSGGGMVAGHFAYKKLPVPQGDLLVVNEYGILGTYLSVPIVNSILGDDHSIEGDEATKRYIVGSMIGATAGLTAGFYRTKNYNYSLQQGAWMQLGELSGSLLGVGTTYLLSNSSSDETPYLWAAGIGATAGLLFTDWLVRTADNNQKQSDKKNKTGWHFDLNPIGIAQSFNACPLPDRPQQNPTQILNNYAMKIALKF